MGGIDRRIRNLEEKGAATRAPDRSSVRPRMREVLDRIAHIRRKGAEASEEERAELDGIGRALRAGLEKRRREGRI